MKIKNDGYGKRRKNISNNINNMRNINEGNGNIKIAEELPENEYYTDIAYKFKWAKWLLVIFLLIFIVAQVIMNPKELNADNLKYLFRYINIQGSNKSIKTEFYIELDEASSICYYKNNIAVLRKNRIDIYDMNGRKNFTHKLIYSNPVVKASDKYIIAYDLGMNKMEIFNSFSRVYEYKNQGPVYGAHVTDNGNVVYITSENGYKSVVYVLDSGFEDIAVYSFANDYVMGADIDDKAGKLAVTGFSARNGDYLSRVILYDTDSEEPVKTIEVHGEQPYGVKLNENGIFAVFENSLRFYDSDGAGISQYNFAYRKIQAMSLTQELAAIVLNEKTLGTDDRILVFDGKGGIIYDNISDAQVIDIKFSEDYKFLYYLARSGLYKIDIEQGISELAADTGEYDDTANFIVYANDKNIYLSGLLKINVIGAN